MNTAEINTFLLNIHDVIAIKIPGFCFHNWKDGKYTYFEYELSGKNTDGWVSCSELEGVYCGENYDTDSSDIRNFKFRVTKPFKMYSAPDSYLSFHPSVIESMAIIQKNKGNILDKVSHQLTIEKTLLGN